ncbi:hypothetical protein ACFVVA_41875 [Kitasatospora sp. NPDC058048]
MDQFFFSFFVVSAITSLLVLIAEAHQNHSAPQTEKEETDG